MKFKEDLKQLCSGDFNGDSGKDYYTEIEVDGETEYVSTFDYWWNTFKKEKLSPAEIAKRALLENFESDKEYYLEYKVNVIETDKEIIVFAAALTYS